MTYYEDFFEFWKINYSHESEYIKCIALRAWDAAVNGSTVDAPTDIERALSVLREYVDEKEAE